MPSTQSATPTVPVQEPEDRRCRCCGAPDAPERLIYFGGTGYRLRRWCLNEVECTRRQDREADLMDRRYVTTAAGRQALAAIEQAQQLHLGRAS